MEKVKTEITREEVKTESKLIQVLNIEVMEDVRAFITFKDGSIKKLPFISTPHKLVDNLGYKSMYDVRKVEVEIVSNKNYIDIYDVSSNILNNQFSN